jgi:hypothetical protein
MNYLGGRAPAHGLAINRRGRRPMMNVLGATNREIQQMVDSRDRILGKLRSIKGRGVSEGDILSIQSSINSIINAAEDGQITPGRAFAALAEIENEVDRAVAKVDTVVLAGTGLGALGLLIVLAVVGGAVYALAKE